MRTAEHLSQFRNRTHKIYGTDDSYGMNGYFLIPLAKTLSGMRVSAHVISGSGNDDVQWEHVSVRIEESKGKSQKVRTPTWDEMCAIKKLFWRDDECVVQFHPPEAEYVNEHPNVLHLWKPINQELEMPPKSAV